MVRCQHWSPHISGLPTTQSAATSGSRNALPRPLNINVKPSSTFPDHLSAYGGHTHHRTTRNSLGRHHFRSNSPRQVFAIRPARVTDVQPYWCVNMFCEKHRNRYVYTTCDGWKRHMKEHETVWPCMQHGLLEPAGVGLICALCGSVNPDESHMAGHSIGDCGDISTKVRGVSRRVNLERHLLRSHAASDHCTRRLADKWKTTLRKKHFACGFCVCIFSTILEQLNHIDMNHFRKGQQITEWSATTVIRGLLLSPKVAYWFQCIRSSDPYAVDRDLHWDWQMVEDLQRRLEMAEDAAEALAFEAYWMLTFNLSRQNPDGQHPSISLSGLKFAGQSEMTMGPFAVSAVNLESNGERRIEEYARGSNHPCFSDESDVAAPSASCPKPIHGMPMNQGNTTEAQSGMKYQTSYPIPPRGLPTITASCDRRSQLAYSPIQTGSAFSIAEFSSTSTNEILGTTAHWQAAPSTTASALYPTEAADMCSEQAKIYQDPTNNIETTGTLTSNLNDLAQSSNLERESFHLDTCDPRDLIKTSK